MKRLLVLAAAVILAACGSSPKEEGPDLLDASAFDTELNGKKISLYTLKNESGMVAQITNYGARMVTLWVPASDGTFKDVIMGFETIDGYLTAKDGSNGPVVGRYGNRIGKGKFTLDDVEYTLSINDGENHLHGGKNGFGSKVWSVLSSDANSVSMEYVSPDGEEGYPGTLTTTVTYTLTADNKLKISYDATTDAPTVLNPTSHAYFNLHGTNSKSTNSHVMRINADSYTPTDGGLIPTGEIAAVTDTPLDFRNPTVIGDRIESDFEAIVLAGGYDHNWIVNPSQGDSDIREVAEVYEPETGIVMTVETDQPGMQFYSGNFMNGKEQGKYGNMNNHRSGIALETQHYPDSPNHPDFPSTTLRPGEVYHHVCIYGFSMK